MVFDLVIGIDFGTSGVGVAYHQPDGTDPPDKRNAQDNDIARLTWGSDSFKKIPAKVGYAYTHEQEPTCWGLQVPADNTGVHVQEWFKMKFGSPKFDQRQVEKVFKDYLTRLNTEISTRLTRDVLRGKSWADANVSFHFSRPSTWNTALVGRFKELVEDAGFGQAPRAAHGCGLHTVDVSLVEPQATAALHLRSDASPVQFKSGQCIIVVDAGAGTTDFSLLKVSNDERGMSRLEEGSPVAGLNIGSAHIDQALQTRITEVLEPYSYALDCEVDKVAWIMRCSEEFQDAKSTFGTSSSIDAIPVPHLKDPESSLGDRTESGMMNGLQKDLRAAFDEQLDKIQGQHYLLLSGGLGSSHYVQERLRTFCYHNKALEETEVMASEEPRMAVSIGLVYDAMNNGKLLAEICCPTSFGLVFRMPDKIPITSRWRSKWRELKDRGLFPNRDSLATGVDWFLQEGTKRTNGEEVTHSYTTSFKEGAARICEVQIIPSSDKDPSPVEKDHTQRCIVMRVDLSQSDPVKESITWRNKSYVTIPFSVKATIRPATVEFRCVDSKGKVVGDRVRFPADGGQNVRPLLMG
ncbi:hypothetical protein CEP53_005839 [Fusarium sp. AF-6]|nr:hypothetical protein CEP53_005839 [Fusarium sp. AF-6]